MKYTCKMLSSCDNTSSNQENKIPVCEKQVPDKKINLNAFVVLQRIEPDILKKYGAYSQPSSILTSNTRSTNQRNRKSNRGSKFSNSLETEHGKQSDFSSVQGSKKVNNKKTVEKWLEGVELSSEEYPMDQDQENDLNNSDKLVKNKITAKSSIKNKRVTSKSKNSIPRQRKNRVNKANCYQPLTPPQLNLLGDKYLKVSLERLPYITLNKYLKQGKDNESSTEMSTSDSKAPMSNISIDSYVHSSAEFNDENKRRITTISKKGSKKTKYSSNEKRAVRTTRKKI